MSAVVIPARRIWLPLALSLALHAGLALAAVFFTAGAGASAGPAISFDTVVLDDTIILEGRSPGKAGHAAEPRRVEGEESDEPFTATVAASPIVTQVSVPTGPEVPGVGAGDGGGGGGGSGALRAPAAARKVVYLIDRSTSMGFGALAVARRELTAGIAALPTDARFAVILYNRQAVSLTLGGQDGLVPATADNRAEAVRLVSQVLAQGGTDHAAAVRQAVALEPDVIFLVTDSDDLTADQARSLTRLNIGHAAILTVEINDGGDSREETPLKLLARLNGGTHRVVRVTK
jgi:hypothetical protein